MYCKEIERGWFFLECLLNINGYIESGFVLLYRQLNYYGLFVDEIYISM